MKPTDILVVEDYEPLLAMIQEVLEGEGYAVRTANTGAKALQDMQVLCPDLIVSDIMMPEMDGYALYEAVRRSPQGARIPFIFLTAKTEKEDVLRAKGLGADDYIPKPFDAEELIVAVRARLSRTQEIVQASEDEFNRLKQQIVSMLSHELRTPLASILGYTEFALANGESLAPEAFRDLLLAIQRGGLRLHRLTESLLVLVQLDTGGATEDYRHSTRIYTNVGEIVERVARQRSEQATDCGLTLAVQSAPDVPPVRLHEAFFADALDRLLDNAIRFSCGRGQQVTLSVRSVPGWVEVAVADQGVGIPQAELPHLFERLRQIDRAKLEQQGAGVGLAVAQGLIRLHGGDIDAESEPGRGSVFTIRLPVASEVSSV